MESVNQVAGKPGARNDHREQLEWKRFDVFRDRASGVGRGPAVVRSPEDPHGLLVLVEEELEFWIDTNRPELVAGGSPSQPFIEWSTPSLRILDQLRLLALNSAGALREVEPKPLHNSDSLRTTQPTWGIYRITRPDDKTFVGISHNVRTQLIAHEMSGLLDFSENCTADVVPIPLGDGRPTITWQALQRHGSDYCGALRTQGHRDVRLLSGKTRDVNALRPYLQALGRRKGLYSNAHNSPMAWFNGRWRLGDQPCPLIHLGLDISNPNGEWDLFLSTRPPFAAIAMAQGTGPWSEDDSVQGTLRVDDLVAQYSLRTNGRDLITDLSQLLPDSEAKLFFAHVPTTFDATFWRPRVGASTEGDLKIILPAALRQLKEADVRDQRVPTELVDEGITLDESFRKGRNLNCTVRFVGPAGTAIYAKTEENSRAVRAEILASMIWHRLGWPGMSTRSVMSADQSVLIIAPVGSTRVEDRFSFLEAFPANSSQDLENPQTILAPRAWTLVRVTLEDLKLADDLDVVRFLVVNAAWGNSDRHAGNIHYGWERRSDSPHGGVGYLLPIDHGRCFLNNNPSSDNQIGIDGSPVDAVVGRIGNPHQLLRPFAELVDRDVSVVAAEIMSWCDRLAGLLGDFVSSTEWEAFHVELSGMLKRVSVIRGAPKEFAREVAEVVVR